MSGKAKIGIWRTLSNMKLLEMEIRKLLALGAVLCSGNVDLLHLTLYQRHSYQPDSFTSDKNIAQAFMAHCFTVT